MKKNKAKLKDKPCERLLLNERQGYSASSCVHGGVGQCKGTYRHSEDVR